MERNGIQMCQVAYLAGVILIKKAGDGSKKIKGCWDSIHVVEVVEKSSGRSAHYKLTSTAMLWLQTNKQGSGTMNLGGSLTRQVTHSKPIYSLSHFLIPIAISLLVQAPHSSTHPVHLCYSVVFHLIQTPHPTVHLTPLSLY